jgi:hypothetical protein
MELVREGRFLLPVEKFSASTLLTVNSRANNGTLGHQGDLLARCCLWLPCANIRFRMFEKAS